MMSSTVAPSSSSSSAGGAASAAPSGLVVHHLQDSRSQRILWLLEEVGHAYSITKYMRTAGGLAPPELIAVHPLGKSPVVTDGGRTLAESGVIVDYLIEHFGPQLRPSASDEDERLSVAYWSQMAEGSLMCPLVMRRVFGAVKTAAPWYVRPVARGISDKVDSLYLEPTLRAQFAFIEAHLQKQRAAGSDFFVSQHLTAADFMMLFPLEAALSRASPLVGEETQRYVHAMHARPAYQRAVDKGGEYAFAKM